MNRLAGFALVALALVLASPAARAQTDAKPAATAAAPAQAPAANEDTDVVQDRAQRLGQTGAQTSDLEGVTRFLQREEVNFRRDLQDYLIMDAQEIERMHALELRDARTNVELSLRAVRDRRRALGTRVASISAASNQLDAMNDEWVKQRERARTRGAPPALLQRIDAVLATIKQARAKLDGRSQRLLDLDNRLAALQDQLVTVSDRLDSARRLALHELFRLTEPTLWEAFGALGSPSATGIAQIRSALPRALETAAQFWDNFSDRVFLHLVLLTVLLGAIASLSFSPAIRALEAQSGAVRVLQRPVSSAVLISLFLTPLFYPGLPIALGTVIRIVSLIPVWRLIPTFVAPAWRALFYSIAGLFALETVFLVLPEGTALSRLAMLAMSAAALWIATVGVRRPFAASDIRTRRWWNGVQLLLRVVRVLLVAAIVANLLGATHLALLVNTMVVAPAYLGIGLAAVVFAIDDFVRLLPHARMMQGVRSVALHRERVLRRAGALTRWSAGIMWLWLTLRLLGVDGALLERAAQLFSASVTIGAYQLSLGRILLFALAAWLSFLAARLTSFILDQDVLPRMRLSRGLPGTISTTSRYAIIAVGLLIAASIAGFDLSQIALILGALSVGIGFGLQTIVNNFISGIILLFERPIQVGDTVQVGDLLGVVREIGIRASNVRTYSGAEVIVPNSELVSGQVINWTLSDRYRRLELDVGVAYGNRPADVIGVLEDVLSKHEGALKTPAPFVRFRGFGDSSLDFRVYVWVDYDEGLKETSAILSAIYDALAEAGIEIPFPQRDLHLRTVSDAARDALHGKPR
jgi:potassium-dependent mechanosensitive channel